MGGYSGCDKETLRRAYRIALRCKHFKIAYKIGLKLRGYGFDNRIVLASDGTLSPVFYYD